VDSDDSALTIRMKIRKFKNENEIMSLTLINVFIIYTVMTVKIKRGPNATADERNVP
jgi:hypothetical protein